MLIGLRFFLIVAVLAGSIAFFGYLFTKNPKFLRFTKTIIKVTLIFVLGIGLIYVGERLIVAL